MNKEEIKKIQDEVSALFLKMTIQLSDIDVVLSSLGDEENSGRVENIETVDIKVHVSEDAQFLIGQNGQTLLELQRLLRIILNKKIGKNFYVSFDVNDYREKKIKYLKASAQDAADRVAVTGERKILPPMSSFERRIVHAELGKRQDVVTSSEGDGIERRLVISPKKES
jgi:spoIIIJ-associated protein